ncbi:unnamed protein product, partial [Prorocentrum cordatum]
DIDKLASFQGEVADVGFSGIWAPAVPSGTSEAGTPAGVAILARTSITITEPPFTKDPVLYPGRLVAAHVHWGARGGLVILSLYLVDSVGLDDQNKRILWTLASYLAKLEAAQMDYIARGDFKMGMEKLEDSSLADIEALFAVPRATTRRPSQVEKGSTIDYFMKSANLAPRAREPWVQEDGTTSPHLPVHLELATDDLDLKIRVPVMPFAIPAVPPVGCARGVEDWGPALAAVRAAADSQGLLPAWDKVLTTVESELLDRYDIVGARRRLHTGRAGEIETTLKSVKWVPPARRVRLGREAQAIKVAARRARHLMGVRAYIQKALLLLHKPELTCALAPRSFSKVAAFLLEAKAYLAKKCSHTTILSHLTSEEQAFFRGGICVLSRDDFEDVAGKIVERCKKRHDKLEEVKQAACVSFAKGSFVRGASRAHRITKTKELQSVLATSEQFIAWQGILAGCSHACFLVPVLLYRLLAGVRSSSVIPRALNDDISLQWIAPSLQQLEHLRKVATRFREGAKSLGIIIQVEKSGYVPPCASVALACKKYGGAKGLKCKNWIRNLGHDLCGARKVRRLTSQRLAGTFARRRRLQMLQKVTGKKVVGLWKTGLLPSAGHGAGVADLSDKHLQQIRADAGRLVGARSGSSSLALYLATQKAKEFDPIYMASCDIICRYAATVWEQRTSLSKLHNAWAHITTQMVRQDKATWTYARGPISATILTLWRINWHMYSSTALVNDRDEKFNLMAISPRDLRYHVVEAIERWQGRRIMSRFEHPLGENAELWVGAYVSVAVPSRQAKYDMKLAGSAACLARGAPSDSPGHMFFGCEVLAPADDTEVAGEGVPDKFVEIRDFMHGKGLQISFGEFEVTTGLPTYFWGDWNTEELQFGNVVYTDGSGLASAIPEIRRCGWAAAQMAAQGWPLRAVYGPLPGPLQTVGRSERFALLMAVRHFGTKLEVVLTDLLALESEVYEVIYKAEIVFAKKVSSYIGWAMQRTLKAGKWEPAVSDAPWRPKDGKQLPVQVTSHAVAKLRDGSVVCRRCARRTSSGSTDAWNFYLRAPCMVNRVDELRTEAMIQFCGATCVQVSAAGAFAMDALGRAGRGSEAEGWEPNAGGRGSLEGAEDQERRAGSQGSETRPGVDRAVELLVSEWHSTDVHVCNGHRLRRAGPTVFCE